MKYKLLITNDVLSAYNEYYFEMYPRRKKVPISNPFHESINTWMIMRRPMMNALKQKWKDFIKWFVESQGYANLHIERCDVSQKVFYPTNRRHDIDNSVPKFILDGLVDGGMIVDDDYKHVRKLILECDVDANNPRTELVIDVLD